jgi:hypothetical protein
MSNACTTTSSSSGTRLRPFPARFSAAMARIRATRSSGERPASSALRSSIACMGLRCGRRRSDPTAVRTMAALLAPTRQTMWPATSRTVQPSHMLAASQPSASSDARRSAVRSSTSAISALQTPETFASGSDARWLRGRCREISLMAGSLFRPP